MFKDTKKELERLEQQLLAVSSPDPDDQEFDDSPEDFYDEFDDDGIVDDELSAMLGTPRKSGSNREFSRRSAGFEEFDDAYEMDRSRYVPAPRKKSPVGMVLVAILELAVAIGLILWWAQHLGWLK